MQGQGAELVEVRLVALSPTDPRLSTLELSDES